MKLSKIISLCCITVLAITTVAGCSKVKVTEEQLNSTEEVIVAQKTDVQFSPQVATELLDGKAVTMYYYSRDSKVRVALDVCTTHNKKINLELTCKGKEKDGQSCTPWEINYKFQGNYVKTTQGELYKYLEDYLAVKK